VSTLHAERCETQRSHRSTLNSYCGSDQSVSATAPVTGWPVDSACSWLSYNEGQIEPSCCCCGKAVQLAGPVIGTASLRKGKSESSPGADVESLAAIDFRRWSRLPLVTNVPRHVCCAERKRKPRGRDRIAGFTSLAESHPCLRVEAFKSREPGSG
jgi:hypothetical protein